jgi:hypothetical protein
MEHGAIHVSADRGVMEQLNRLADFKSRNPGYNPQSVKVCISEKYLRKKIGLTDGAPLMYRGMRIECVSARVTEGDSTGTV